MYDFDSSALAMPVICNNIKNSRLSLNEELELNEVKANPDQAKKLKKEIKELRGLLDDYGIGYFVGRPGDPGMPFCNFEDDPISFEYNYPQTTRIIKEFWREMEDLDRADLENEDLLEDKWENDFDKHDFDTVLKVAEIISNKPGKNKQFQKVYHNGLKPAMDDDEILANREREDELAAEYGDDLNEDTITKLPRRRLGRLSEEDANENFDKEFQDNFDACLYPPTDGKLFRVLVVHDNIGYSADVDYDSFDTFEEAKEYADNKKTGEASVYEWKDGYWSDVYSNRNSLLERLVYGIYTRDGDGRREVDRVDTKERAIQRVSELGERDYWWDEVEETGWDESLDDEKLLGHLYKGTPEQIKSAAEEMEDSYENDDTLRGKRSISQDKIDSIAKKHGLKENYYKGYGIDYDVYGRGEYSVQVNGDDIFFSSEDEAKEFIDSLSDDESLDESLNVIKDNQEFVVWDDEKICIKGDADKIKVDPYTWLDLPVTIEKRIEVYDYEDDGFLGEDHNKNAGIHEFGEDPLELDMEDPGEPEDDLLELDDESLNEEALDPNNPEDYPWGNPYK